MPEGQIYRPDESVEECLKVVCACSPWDPAEKSCWGRPVPCGGPIGVPTFKPPEPEDTRPPKKVRSVMSKMLCNMGFAQYCPGPEDMPSAEPFPEDQQRTQETEKKCEEMKANCEKMTAPASEMCLNTLPPECAAWGPIWEEPAGAEGE